MHYSILEDWVDKGRSETLPEEMATYLSQLTLVNQLWNACNSPNKIVQKLQVAFPELNGTTARSRMQDAFTWFYLDDNVKKDAYRNMLFEKMMKLVDATILSATGTEDYDRASKILERAYRIKQLDKDDVDELPEEAYKKPFKIYSSDIGDFKDLPEPADRKLLAEYIDQMNLTEAQSIKIRQDAGIEPKTLFDHEAFQKTKD